MPARIEINIEFSEKGLSTVKQGAAALADLSKTGGAASATIGTLDRANTKLYSSQIAVARAQRDYAAAIALADTRLRSLTPGTASYNNVLAQKISLSRQAANAQRDMGAGAGALSSNLMGLAGSLGIATTGAALFAAGVDTAVDSFKLAAMFESNQQAVRRFSGDLEKGNQILAAGERFANKYAYKQSEVAAALAGSSLALRQTGVNAEDLLEVYALLQAANPAEGFAGAQIAVAELISGDTTSLKERFRVAGDGLKQLKADIAAGIPFTDALRKALADLGITQEALTDRTKGAQGSINRLSKSWDDLTLAAGQAFVAMGAPEVLTYLAEGFQDLAEKAKPFIDGLRLIHDLLSSEVGPSVADTGRGAMELYTHLTSLSDGFAGTATRADQLKDAILVLDAASIDSLETTIQQQHASALLAEAKVRLEQAARGVETGMYSEAAAAAQLSSQLGITTDEAKRLLAVQTALARLQAPDRARKLASSLAGDVAGGAGRELDRAETEIERARAKAIADAERARNKAMNAAARDAKAYAKDREQEMRDLAKAQDDLRSDSEKLAARLAEQAGTTDETRRLQLEREILDLREKIADASERAARAEIDAALARLKDREQDVKDRKALEQAQRVLRAQDASQTQKEAARREIERIGLEDRQRALDIAKQDREAGVRTITLPADALRPVVSPEQAAALQRQAAALATIPGGYPAMAAGGATGAAAPQPIVIENHIKLVLANGDVLAELVGGPITSNVMAHLHTALTQATAAGVLAKSGKG